MTLTLTFKPLRAMVMTYSHAKGQSQRSVGSDDREFTNGRKDRRMDGRTDGDDCITWPANTVGENCQVVTLMTTTAESNLVQIRSREASGQIGEMWNNNENFTYLFIDIHFSGTHLQVRTIRGFLRAMTQTTRTHARVCLWGFRWYFSPLMGSIPIKPSWMHG